MIKRASSPYKRTPADVGYESETRFSTKLSYFIVKLTFRRDALVKDPRVIKRSRGKICRAWTGRGPGFKTQLVKILAIIKVATFPLRRSRRLPLPLSILRGRTHQALRMQ